MDTQGPIGRDDKLAKARQQVAAIKGFYLHLFVFAVVILGLTVIDAATGRGWWVQWVFLGWGVGVLAHALFVFAGSSRYVTEWEERKTRELMDRM